jgi:hypothetical protein
MPVAHRRRRRRRKRTDETFPAFRITFVDSSYSAGLKESGVRGSDQGHHIPSYTTHLKYTKHYLLATTGGTKERGAWRKSGEGRWLFCQASAG